MPQQWEYAIMNPVSGPASTFWISYCAPGDDNLTEGIPAGAWSSEIGSLGERGWEMVTAVHAYSPDGTLREWVYFKRPHDPDRSVKV